jgi:hypothetical protein
MGVINHGLLILLVAIITLSNNEFRFLFCLVRQNLTDFKENEDFSALDYTFMITMSYFRTQEVKNETARSNFEIAIVTINHNDQFIALIEKSRFPCT